MTTNETLTSGAVIACIPDAVPADKRERWMQIGLQVYAAVQEVRELPDGYACRLPSDSEMLVQAAEYVSLDRNCCQFMRWSLVIEPNSGPLWLELRGGEGVKEYLRSNFETSTLLPIEVAQAAGFSISAHTDWVHPSDPTLSTAS